jgi:AraC-like DNA-binding protein
MALREARSFTEPGAFAAAVRGEQVDLCILAAGPFNAKLTQVELNSLSIQRFSESHPCILHSTNTSGRAVIAFHTEPGPSVFRSGIEVNSNSIARSARYQSHFQRSTGPLCWGTMSLPVDEMHLAGIAAGGYELAPPSSEVIVTPQPDALAKLQRLHHAAGMLAEGSPKVLDHPEVARGLEQALLQAMVSCLCTDDDCQNRAAQRRHSTIMRRFHSVLQADAERPFYVLEIAEAIGTSVRSLSACCQAQLGMGPKKYLLLRRMNLARQALSMGDPCVTRVTDVATRYGFWQFGRFAVEYKSLFGESPSATLRREPA